jgi:serine/threonine-protein kinase
VSWFEERGLAPGGRLGGYVVEEVLGRGTTGVVFRAVRETDGERVALKVLRPQLSRDPAFVQRFLREAGLAGAVQHRHLVPILDAGERDGRHYLAAGYIDGGSLRQRLDDGRPISLAELLRLAGGIGAGLDALHRAGLVHRDVKPANVLLGSDGTALLGDFGLVKGAAYSVVTQPGELMGTPAYMAPELIDGDEATAAADVYALGCVLFECVAGAPPFASPSLVEMIAARLLQDPPDPCARRPDLPPGIGRAILCALERDPARRPATGMAVANLVSIAARSAGP